MSDNVGMVGKFISEANGHILALEEGQSLTRGDVSLLRLPGNVFECRVYETGFWYFYSEFSVEQIEYWGGAPF